MSYFEMCATLLSIFSIKFKKMYNYLQRNVYKRIKLDKSLKKLNF